MFLVVSKDEFRCPALLEELGAALTGNGVLHQILFFIAQN